MGSYVCNEILDILGKMRPFDELNQVPDAMSKREGLVNEETYRVLVNRYGANVYLWNFYKSNNQ